MSEKKAKNYRPNVCAVISNKSMDKVLLCHRIDFKYNKGWQFPQGGYDPELDLIDEMKRELQEEISCDSVSVLKVLENEYYYDFPARIFLQRGGYRGQRQIWVHSVFEAADSEISIDTEIPEFDSWKWATPQEAIDLVVSFKKDIYRDALTELDLIK